MGTTHATDDPNYLGVEAVWNTNNYWVNMQAVPLPVASYDLWDSANWEYVFVESPQQMGLQTENEGTPTTVH